MTGLRTKGAIRKTQGKAEEELGKLTGDKQKQVQGMARQVQGDAQALLGDVQDAVSKFEWPTLDLSSFDAGKTMAGAAAAAHIGRRARRPRWPLAFGGVIVAGVASWVILSNEALRARLARGASTIREWISAARSKWSDRVERDRENPIAFAAAETAPIESSTSSKRKARSAAGYPAGLGSNNGDGIPKSQEAGSPA